MIEHHRDPVAAIRVVALGNAQDAGVPQMGCSCSNCVSVREGREGEKWVTALGIIDDAERAFWIVDATPNFPQQYDFLLDIIDDSYKLQGIILTHVHIGHYLGLVYLGREAFNSVAVPIISTELTARFLADNAPFSQLVDLNNVTLAPTDTHIAVPLSKRLTITLFPVPHRNELSDTVAVQITGPSSSLLYIPDIDDWNQWKECKTVMKDVPTAIVDGTFYNNDELPNRDRRDIPHPTILESMQFFQPLVSTLLTQIYFTHFNHTNRLWRSDAVKEVAGEGFQVLDLGTEFTL